MKLILFSICIAVSYSLPQNRAIDSAPVWNIATKRQTSTRLDSETNCAGPGTECVPYFMCNDQVPVDSTGLIDISLSEVGPCTGSVDVCCAESNKTTNIPEPPPVTSQGCGFRNIDGIGFRINNDKDNEAQFGEFPWMAAVLEKQQRDGAVINLYQCGGSLIHPRVVLTAAHCVAEKPNNILKVRLGEWDTQTTSEPLPYQDRDVVEVNIHPEFKNQALANDIALLFLASPVDIAANVRPVCLPPSSESFDHRSCYATGWGKDKHAPDAKYQEILKKVDLPIIPNDECQSMLRTTRLSEIFELHDSFICAGGEKGKDTCRGDGGSPLVCPVPGSPMRYYQAGIVAWGIGCGNSNIPGVYARVPLFREWIDNALARKGIETSSYVV